MPYKFYVIEFWTSLVINLTAEIGSSFLLFFLQNMSLHLGFFV
jgi:hypothetical protein